MDRFRPGDEEAVVAAFRAVYGEDYPFPLVYEAGYWLAQDRLYTFLARDEHGRVLALNSFFHTGCWAGLYEWGQLLVCPEARGAGLARRLVQFSNQQFGEADAIYTEVGCHWTASQRIQSAVGYRETALAVDLLAQDRRVSAVMGFRSRLDRAQTVFLGEEYAELTQWIYQGLGLQRQFRAGSGLAPQAEVRTGAIADLLRSDVLVPGADLPERLQGEAPVWQVRLPLEDERTPAGARLLWRHGFRPCGVIPRWFDGDALLMQRHRAPPDFSGLQLHTERARELAARVASVFAVD